MNVVKLNGGLGNQLFQVSAGLFIENEIDKIFFETSLVDTRGLKSLIGGFNTVDVTYANNIAKLSGNFYLDKLLKKIYKSNPMIFTQYKYWGAPKDSKLIESPIKKPVLLDGYWQDLNLVSGVLPIIRKLIDYREFSDEFYKYRVLLSRENTVTVHVRRGDYTTPQFKDKFDVCGVDYFRKSIEKALEFVGDNSHFYFFTNDVDWVKKNLIQLVKEYTFVSGNLLRDYEEMLLLGSAHVSIISNSTFSWWGVNLNGDKKLTICPKKWFVHADRPELIPDNWIRI